MRPLHRPMFKYGGPIKEGVMSGIKEPVKKAALVGNSVYPQTSGREHHKLNIFGWGSKGANVGKAGGAGQGIITQKVAPLWNKFKNIFKKPPSTYKVQEKGIPKDLQGIFVKKTPTSVIKPGSTVGPGIGTNQWYWQKGVKPVFGGAAWATKKALPYATTGGLIFAGGSWLWPDGTPATTEEVKQHHAAGMGDGKGGDGTGNIPTVSAAQLRKEQIQKYRDIMDIKSMNQEAAYNSLIEASKHVTESEDFKGDIKSGKLINKIIQGASKMYDKPKATKDAIDTLILKGEIEKDLNKDKNALLDAYRIKQMEALDRAAKEDSLQGDMKAHYLKHNVMPSGKSLASLAIMRGADIVKVANTTEVTNWLNNNEGKDEVDFMEFIIKDPENTVEPGIHVVGSALISVDENKRLQRVG